MLLIIFTLYIRSIFKYMTLTRLQRPDKPAAMIESPEPAPLVSQEASCCRTLVAGCRKCVLLAIPSCGLRKWKQIMKIDENFLSPSLDPIPSFTHIRYALIHDEAKL